MTLNTKTPKKRKIKNLELKKTTDTNIEQTRTKPQGILEIKKTKFNGEFLFDRPLSIKDGGRWLELPSFEV